MKRNPIMERARKLANPEVKARIDFSIGITKRIMNILETKGMMQKDFAKLMGKSESEISKWLQGTHNFTIETILKIQAKLGVDILEIACSKPNDKTKELKIAFGQSYYIQKAGSSISGLKNNDWHKGEIPNSTPFCIGDC